ncbi:DUF6688 family protein [Ruminococcus sp.]|uniref:DUF6688 domain-containing protein n=1 Tax=Ruminococcus sp. TaxID=41978 RepID=UPI00345D4AD2
MYSPRSCSYCFSLPYDTSCRIFSDNTYVILGQVPDGVIKEFTVTADRTFSQQVPSPLIDYDGHYLCTVAVPVPM